MSDPASLILLDPGSPLRLRARQTYRRRGTDGLWRRFRAVGDVLHVVHGEGGTARREVLRAGDALRLGRRALPVGRMVGSARYPDAALWRGFLSRSPALMGTLSHLAGAAFSDAPISIRGESGTGKELAARALHDVGPRRAGPFVALNCAAMPETLAEAELFGARRGAYTGAQRDRAGAFERADGGTLFLDEVGDLSPVIQAKLLRALETGEALPLGAERPVSFDVRVVSATWRALEVDADSGAFRFDLLQRLSVLQVELPALRERRQDLGPLLEVALADLDACDLWPSARVLASMHEDPWPGNVRQLRSLAQRAAVWGDPNAFVPKRVLTPPHRMRLERGRSRLLREAHPGLAATDAVKGAGGNRSEAARRLGVSRSTLYRWLSPAGPLLERSRDRPQLPVPG
ncbi:MAG: sigma 54-interacting transcriptional regulator [Myxococcota bacterium]